MQNQPCRCQRCQAGAAEVFEMLAFPAPRPFSEAEEAELAMELLSVSSEAEMDLFLGKVFRNVWKGVKKIGSAAARFAKPLGAALKGVAKIALPFVGGALGSFIPIPGVGTMVGKLAGTALSNALEMELEGVGAQEQEFEMALRFVRIAGSAAERAAQVARAAPGHPVDSLVRTALGAALRGYVQALPPHARRRQRQRQRLYGMSAGLP